VVAYADLNDPVRWHPLGERVRYVVFPTGNPGAAREKIGAMLAAAREMLR
jgi:hypothetical protein